MNWVKDQFGWSISTADKYMNVHRMFRDKLPSKFVENMNMTVDMIKRMRADEGEHFRFGLRAA